MIGKCGVYAIRTKNTSPPSFLIECCILPFFTSLIGEMRYFFKHLSWVCNATFEFVSPFFCVQADKKRGFWSLFWAMWVIYLGMF